MKTITSILSLFILLIPVFCFSQAGTIDNSFLYNYGAHPQGGANAVAIQKDGKIVLGGTSLRGFTLVRYNTGGQIDKTFGDKGIAYFYTGPDNATVNSIAIQPDGKIVAAGTDTTNFAVKRFNVNGTLDSSFGINGQVTTWFQNKQSVANGVIIQPDNKILVVGKADYVGGDVTKIALARYNPDGTLDTSFGSKGKEAKSYTEFDFGTSLILKPSKKIIVAGTGSYGFAYDFAVIRYKSNGDIDKTFGNNGIAFADFGSTSDVLTSAAVQSDGKIITAGFSFTNTPYRKIALARFTEDGKLDSTFGTDGKVLTDFYGLESWANGLVIQPDDKILIAAGVDSVDGFGVARFTKNGELDNSFGNGGKVITQYLSEDKAITLQKNGKIVAAGTWDGHFVVIRYLNDAATLNLTADNSDLKIADNGSASVKLFPNPVKDVLHISGAGNASFLIYNSQGKLVMQGMSANEICNLTIKFLPAGVYYLQIKSENKKTTTLKFIKQ